MIKVMDIDTFGRKVLNFFGKAAVVRDVDAELSENIMKLNSEQPTKDKYEVNYSRFEKMEQDIN